MPKDCSQYTCTAGAGTLLLEFGILGKLLDDPSIENVARRALDALWSFRSNATGLFGKVILDKPFEPEKFQNDRNIVSPPIPSHTPHYHVLCLCFPFQFSSIQFAPL